MLTLIGSIAAGSAANALAGESLSQTGHTGLLIEADTIAALRSLDVTLQLYGRESEELLCPQLPMDFLADRADWLAGFSLGQARSFASVNAALDAVGDPASDLVSSPVLLWLDQGHVQLDGEEELSIQVRSLLGTGVGGGVRIYSADVPGREEELHKFVRKDEGTANFNVPREVWAYNTVEDIAAASIGEASVQVTGGRKTTLCDVKAYHAYTRATGITESEGPRRSALLYREPARIVGGGKLSVLKSGSNASDYSIIGLERLLIPERVQRAATKKADDGNAARRSLATSSEVLRAARMAGIAP